MPCASNVAQCDGRAARPIVVANNLCAIVVIYLPPVAAKVVARRFPCCLGGDLTARAPIVVHPITRKEETKEEAAAPWSLQATGSRTPATWKTWP